MKSPFLKKTASFYMPFFIAFLFYLTFDHAYLSLATDLNGRFGFPITEGPSIYFYMVVFTDYTLFSLSLLVLFIGFLKSKVSNKHMIISGLIANLLMLFSHTYLLDMAYIGTYYSLTFAVYALGFILYFYNQQKKFVSNILILITTTAYYCFLMMLHVVFVYNSLFPHLEQIKSKDDASYEIVLSSIKTGQINTIKEAYGDLFKQDSFAWQDDNYPKQVQNESSVLDAFAKMKDVPKWSYHYKVVEIERNNEQAYFYSLTTNGSNKTLNLYSLELNSVKEVYWTYFKLIYSSLMIFTIIWLIGMFKLMVYHDNVVKK